MAITTAQYDIGQACFNGVDVGAFTHATMELTASAWTNPAYAETYQNSDMKLTQAHFTPVGTSYLPCILEFTATISQTHTIQILGATASTQYCEEMDILAQVTIYSNSETNRYAVGLLPLHNYAALYVIVKDRASDTKLTLTQVTLTPLQDFAAATNTSLAKMAIQGAPKTRFIINGELFQIGRSGKFELYNKNIAIYSLGIEAVEGSPFIVTYKWIPQQQ